MYEEKPIHLCPRKQLVVKMMPLSSNTYGIIRIDQNGLRQKKISTQEHLLNLTDMLQTSFRESVLTELLQKPL